MAKLRTNSDETHRCERLFMVLAFSVRLGKAGLDKDLRIARTRYKHAQTIYCCCGCWRRCTRKRWSRGCHGHGLYTGNSDCGPSVGAQPVDYIAHADVGGPASYVI